MDKLYLQLGRTGDILNVLPLARADALAGLKVGFMACPEFADVLDGCGYVEKVVFPGRVWEVAKAHAEALKLCPNVLCLQVNGPKDEVLKCTYEPAGQTNAVTDSHNREQWKLAKRLPDWGALPLIFDQRSAGRDLLPTGYKKGRKVILVSADSSSSPFPFKPLLLKLLQFQYPKAMLVDLAPIKADRFYDLLSLYEIAHCLVTVDTAHLHLAYACPQLPVMALIQDRPLYWHGSAWRPQHHFSCRYGDFPFRALELFTAIDELSQDLKVCRAVHVYPGEVRPNDGFVNFPIQPGACHRDSVNVLNDKDRHPMLRNVIRMMTATLKPEDAVVLTRRDTQLSDFQSQVSPGYAFRMNRDKSGQATWAPVPDLFAAPVKFWQDLFPHVPDVVMGADSYWSRILLELFKANGAREVEGIYRYG